MSTVLCTLFVNLGNEMITLIMGFYFVVLINNTRELFINLQINLTFIHIPLKIEHFKNCIVK